MARRILKWTLLLPVVVVTVLVLAERLIETFGYAHLAVLNQTKVVILLALLLLCVMICVACVAICVRYLNGFFSILLFNAGALVLICVIWFFSFGFTGITASVADGTTAWGEFDSGATKILDNFAYEYFPRKAEYANKYHYSYRRTMALYEELCIDATQILPPGEYLSRMHEVISAADEVSENEHGEVVCKFVYIDDRGMIITFDESSREIHYQINY